MRKTVVIDFDGTLSNLDHRLHFIDGNKKDWDSFFGACIDDQENLWCGRLMEALAKYGYSIVIVSGRPERCRVDSEKWLKLHMITYNELVLVREDGDHAPDDLLKEQWLKSFGPEKIEFVIDDRQRVVEMWRRNGVTCLQCNSWEEK